VALIALFAAGCFSDSGDGDSSGPSSSSGSHWLACDEDGDCAAHGKGTTCGKEGVCVSASGEPIEVTGGTGGAGNTATGKSAGTGGTTGEGEACGPTTCRAGSRCCNPCTGSCVDEDADVECIGDACMGAGTGGTSSGYDPCAGKSCGDDCTRCPPGDPDCAESLELKYCNAAGECEGVEPNCEANSGCPASMPRSGDACDESGLGCDYGDRACGCGPCSNAPGSGGCPEGAEDGTLAWNCPVPEPGCPPACAGCAAPDTPIATPTGERPIAELRAGDLVYSLEHDAIVVVPIARTSRTAVHEHVVVRLALANGRELWVSGVHPAADGRPFADLRAGDDLDGVAIEYAEVVPYPFAATHDILPASTSGAYFAAGVAIGSTLGGVAVP
jgi:hypothetical protein